jgi:hypothetical protein
LIHQRFKPREQTRSVRLATVVRLPAIRTFRDVLPQFRQMPEALTLAKAQPSSPVRSRVQ